MRLRPFLRLLLAGLLALLAPFAPAGPDIPPLRVPDTPPLRVGYRVALADPNDWPMFRHDPACNVTGQMPNASCFP